MFPNFQVIQGKRVHIKLFVPEKASLFFSRPFCTFFKKIIITLEFINI